MNFDMTHSQYTTIIIFCKYLVYMRLNYLQPQPETRLFIRFKMLFQWIYLILSSHKWLLVLFNVLFVSFRWFRFDLKFGFYFKGLMTEWIFIFFLSLMNLNVIIICYLNFFFKSSLFFPRKMIIMKKKTKCYIFSQEDGKP